MIKTGNKNNQNNREVKLYFKNTYPFITILTNYFMIIAFGLSYIPSLAVQTIMRKKFGERYFSIEFVVIAVFVMLYPVYDIIDHSSIRNLNSDEYNWSWILAAFTLLGFSVKRFLEIDRSLTTYDDQKFSLSDGELLDFWYRFESIFPLKKHPFHYYITRYFEGGTFVILGYILSSIDYTEQIGNLILYCGLGHIIFDYLKYKISRDHLLEKIDEKIVNEGLYDAFVNNQSKHGFKWSGPRPDDLAFREEIAKSFLDDYEDQASRVS